MWSPPPDRPPQVPGAAQAGKAQKREERAKLATTRELLMQERMRRGRCLTLTLTPPPPKDAGDLWRPARRDEAGRSEIRSAVYCGVGHFAAGQQEGDVWFEWPKSIPKGGWLFGWGLGGWWRLLDVRH